MLSRHGARLAALLAPAALLLPTAAHAEQVTVDDAVGDAKALNFASELGGGGEGEPLFLDAPAEASVDITRTVVTHGKRVTVTTYFRDLVHVAEHSLDMRIFTPDARFSFSAARSEDGSTETLLHQDVVRAAQGPLVRRPCHSVRARYDVAAGLVTASFPAKCVDEPRWVQVAVMASRFAVTPLDDGSVNLAAYGDDAFRGGLNETSRGRSPKVRRG